MDILAGQAISLLVPYLKTLGQKAVKGIASKLYELVKAKFSFNPTLNKIFSNLEQSPDDTNKQVEVQSELQKMIDMDNSFAKQIADVINSNSKTNIEKIDMKTEISGNVGKQATIGNVEGDVNF